MRARRAVALIPRVMAGRTRWARVPLPATGNQPSPTEKMRMARRPNQKTGMETPRRASTITERSKPLPGRRAARTPRGIPVSTATKMAAEASSRVLGK